MIALMIMSLIMMAPMMMMMLMIMDPADVILPFFSDGNNAAYHDVGWDKMMIMQFMLISSIRPMSC